MRWWVNLGFPYMHPGPWGAPQRTLGVLGELRPTFMVTFTFRRR